MKKTTSNIQKYIQKELNLNEFSFYRYISYTLEDGKCTLYPSLSPLGTIVLKKITTSQEEASEAFAQQRIRILIVVTFKATSESKVASIRKDKPSYRPAATHLYC